MTTDQLLYYRKRIKYIFLKKIFTKLIRKNGAIIPLEVTIGEKVQFIHDGLGCVLHPNTVIGNNVRIFQGVTIGKKDVINNNIFTGKIIVCDDATICSGAQILADNDSQLVVGKKSVVASNAVVLSSIPDGEVWGGIPARKIKEVTYEKR